MNIDPRKARLSIFDQEVRAPVAAMKLPIEVKEQSLTIPDVTTLLHRIPFLISMRTTMARCPGVHAALH
jgi:hypothetical protein